MFVFVISFFSAGCNDRSNQLFIPEISSGEEATNAVFVPAVQSGNVTVTKEIHNEPHSAPLSGTTSSATPQGVKEQTMANADVLFVRAQLAQDNTWTFSVTVSHPDSGWADYADGWDVLLPDDTVLKSDSGSPFTRLLLHPHVGEQPFTRSQSGIEIPGEIKVVTVRAHDIVDGFGGKEITVDLTADSGPGFEVQR